MRDQPWVDPIVEEVRRVREAYAARFNYDLKAIVHDIQRREKESGLKFVNLAEQSKKKPKRKPRVKSKK